MRNNGVVRPTINIIGRLGCCIVRSVFTGCRFPPHFAIMAEQYKVKYIYFHRANTLSHLMKHSSKVDSNGRCKIAPRRPSSR
jgi:hypothetical protein